MPVTEKIGPRRNRWRQAINPKGTAITNPTTTAITVSSMCCISAARMTCVWPETQSHRIHGSSAAPRPPVPRLLGWDKRRIARRVNELLELVGLDPRGFARRYPHQLSGGQRQRVGVARALGADPPVLLMDEPFGAIDRIARERLQNEFLRIQREVRKTVVFVTHDIDEAIKLGDRIAIMNAGRLEQYDTPAAILAKPASDLVIDLLGPDRGLKRLSVTPIDIKALEQPPVVHADDSLSEARRALDSRWDRVIVVDRNGQPAGELTKDDADGDGRVADRARPFDAIIGADRTLYDAFSQMLIHQATWVAVVDGNQFRGVLTPQSFVAAIQRVPAELEGARR